LPDSEKGSLSEGEEERSRLVKGKTWLLHHDNALAYFSLLICDFLTKHETMLVPQPLYPADLAAADIFFTTLKSVLKGRQFESAKEI
jgi:hypothetical protein